MKKENYRFTSEALKLSFAISFLLMFFESISNYTFFYSYFPRGGFFKLFLDINLIKFLIFPTLQLTIVTFLIYFSVIFFFIIIIIKLYCKLKKYNKKTKYFFFLFSIISFYIGLYFCYSLNLFYHPLSYGRHPFIYNLFFPPRDIYVPFSIARVFTIYISAFYWVMLFIIAFFKQMKKIFFILISVMLICFFVYFKIHKQIVFKEFKSKENIIVIGIDSLQYNRLCKNWGYKKNLMPNVCQFLKESNYFVNAWTPFARTYPSYNSILTGRYPINNGARANLIPDHYLKEDNVYLGDILKDKGYYRLHCTDDVRFSNIRKRHGFDQIFSPRKDVAGMLITSFYDYSFSNILMQKFILPWLFKPVFYNRAHLAYNPQTFIQKAIDQINNLPRNKPSFIVIHLCGNHYPYTVPHPYARNYYLENVSEKNLQMVDDQFGQLLKYLKRVNLYEKSLIILLSDHGSGWDPKYQKLSHGSHFKYSWSNRMVLALRFPYEVSYPNKINKLVRSVDIYPTVLDYLGIEQNNKIDGISLMSLLEQKKSEERNLFAETGYSFSTEFGDKNFSLNHKKIKSEIKKFKVDSKTGYLYIREKDYQSLLDKKWYMLIEKGKRLVYNPFLKIIKVNKIDPNTGEDITPPKNVNVDDSGLDDSEMSRLKSEIIKHFRLDQAVQ